MEKFAQADHADQGMDEFLLKAIVHVGEALGFRVIAEMVEDAGLIIKLMSLSVPFAQGFGICKPRPIGEFAAS